MSIETLFIMISEGYILYDSIDITFWKSKSSMQIKSEVALAGVRGLCDFKGIQYKGSLGIDGTIL